MIALLILSVALVFAQPSPPDPSTPVAAGDVFKNPSLTIESSLNLRDPFSRLVQKDGEGIADTQIPELERHDIDKLKLVGVITGPRKNKALIMTPDSKMHVVAENAVLGTRKGHVVRIERDGVVVHEKVVNLLGQEESVESTIEFTKKK